MSETNFDNYIARINSLFEEYTERHEEINNIYAPELEKIKKSLKTINWMFIYSILGSLFLGYASYYLYFTMEYWWYISIIPVVLGLGFFIFCFIRKRIYDKKKKKITSEWQKASKIIEGLDKKIQHDTDVAVEIMLDEFSDDKDEVIKVIGTSYHDLLEYYEYYQDFIVKNPGVKPTIKRIKTNTYRFEELIKSDNFDDDQLLDTLFSEITKDNCIDIIHIINNYKLNYRIYFIGSLISYINNSTFMQNTIEEANNLLTYKIDYHTISGYGFFAYYRDIQSYNLRYENKYEDMIDYNNIYREMYDFLSRNKVFNVEKYPKKALFISCLAKILFRYGNSLSEYDVNTFTKLLLNVEATQYKQLKNTYYKLYNNFFSVLSQENLIKIYEKIVLIELSEKDFEKASNYLSRIEKKDPNNLFMKLHKVLIKYNTNNFNSLFKRYKYYTFEEFRIIEKFVTDSKDPKLIDQLFDFKKKYNIKK